VKVLILGYGDVGRNVAEELISKDIEVVVVDIRDLKPTKGIKFIRGDVTLESFWKDFDLSRFNAVVVALPEDLHSVFCVLMIRNKNKDIEIYARCNSSEYVEKLYKAGADHVINLPVVTAELIISEIFGEEIRRRLTFENIEVKIFAIDEGSKLIGTKIENIRKLGIIPLAVFCNGEVHISESFKIRKNCQIAVAGRSEELVRFEAEYMVPQ